MILGLNLYGPLANTSMDEIEFLTAIKEIGYDRIEPCIKLRGESDNKSFWSVKHFVELLPTIRNLGLDVVSCHVITDNLLEDYPVMCTLAETYGIEAFVVKMPRDLSEISIEETAFTYRMIADELEEFGGILLLHNRLEDTATKIKGRTAYEYMLDICLGRVGMQLDTGWCAAGGVDPVEIFKRNETRVESVHFKDFADVKNTQKDCIIGEGSLDNPLYMQFGRANGIPLFVDQDCYADVIKDAKKSYDYLIDEGQQREHTVSYLNIYDTVTKQVKILKKFDYVIEAPNWVNNGNYLVYNKDGLIYRFDLETFESTQIESGIANRCNNDHVVSKDETLIAVSSDYETEAGGGSRIFVLPLEGGEAKLVTPNAPSYLHGFSPDNKELAYCAFREVNGKMSVDVYTIGLDGGDEKRLTTEGFNDGPEYSPDGKHIWYISTRSGLMQVYRMNTDGTDDRQMTFEYQNNWFGHVSPDCKKVVNLSYREGDLRPSEHLPNMQVDLWMMDYDGSNREKLFTFFGGQGSINVNSWDASSRYFAFVSYGVEI